MGSQQVIKVTTLLIFYKGLFLGSGRVKVNSLVA